jgi:hypothetical protein
MPKARGLDDGAFGFSLARKGAKTQGHLDLDRLEPWSGRERLRKKAAWVLANHLRR